MDDPAAVELALSRLDIHYIASAIQSSVCARAADAVLARFEASAALRLDAPSYERSETWVLAALLSFLGRHRVPSAWEKIAELYREHPDSHVRLASGHALFAYADARSLDLLASFVESDTDRRRFFAIKALLARDPAHVVDALGGLDALRAEAKRALCMELFDQAARPPPQVILRLNGDPLTARAVGSLSRSASCRVTPRSTSARRFRSGRSGRGTTGAGRS